jgi:hypothetical protein
LTISQEKFPGISESPRSGSSVSEIILLGALVVLDSNNVLVICGHWLRAEIQPCQKLRNEASSARKSALSTE